MCLFFLKNHIQSTRDVILVIYDPCFSLTKFLSNRDKTSCGCDLFPLWPEFVSNRYPLVNYSGNGKKSVTDVGAVVFCNFCRWVEVWSPREVAKIWKAVNTRELPNVTHVGSTKAQKVKFINFVLMKKFGWNTCFIFSPDPHGGLP